MGCCGRAASVLCLVLLASPVHAAWHRLDSPNFVVVGDASERQRRDVAVRFEAFREVLGRLRGNDVAIAAVPTVILVDYKHQASRAAAAAQQPAPPPASGDPPPTETVQRLEPVFRKMQANEERVDGVLQRIECSRRGAITFVLQSADKTVRLSAPRLKDVEFITYRDDLTGDVSCGPLKEPMRVYVTSRAAAAPNGTPVVVAIEFLPKDIK